MPQTLTYQHHRGECNILFDSFYSYIKNLPLNSVLIIDKNVFIAHQNIFEQIEKPIFIFHASEKRKTISLLENIFTFFQKNYVDKNFYIVVIGGGITCDLGAMAASIWKRGCNLILIPTTLLAMVDAAIGGKTAINFNSIKNSIGTFYHPNFILIDPYWLNTLPKNIYLEGFPEMIKHALTLNQNLVHPLLELKNSSNSYEQKVNNDIIYENIKTKLDLVNKDPDEKNVRKILNFGHTVGHAIEMAYGLPHGISVANGMLIEIAILMSLGYIDDLNLLHISNILLEPFKSRKIKNRIDPLVPFLLQDKKKNNQEITIPVIKNIGNTYIKNILFNDFVDALQKTLLNGS